MKLDERKLKILDAIVRIYTVNGEPVGSKVLSEQLNIGVSPATIRNDMAVLFEMGLLEQPHTSAGRIPSHLGYRIYIDSLMQPVPLTQREKNEIEAMFNVRNPDPEQLLKSSAQVLAEYTGCAAVISTLTPRQVVVNRIAVIPAGERTAAILLIASNGMIKTKVCRVDFQVTPQIAEFFNQYANGRLGGISLNEITSQYLSAVAIPLGDYSQIFTPVLSAIYELCREINEGQFYVEGFTNLLSYREFSPVAYELLTFLQNREELTRMILRGNTKTTLTIGRENTREELTGSAVAVTRYAIGTRGGGAVMLVGPVRLNYPRLIPHMEYFADTLGKLLAETFGRFDTIS